MPTWIAPRLAPPERTNATTSLPRRRRSGGIDDVASSGVQLLVELELPVVTAECHAVAELAEMRRDLLAARHPHDQLGIRAVRERRIHGRRKRAAEPRVDIGDTEADVLVSEHLHCARPPDT